MSLQSRPRLLPLLIRFTVLGIALALSLSSAGCLTSAGVGPNADRPLNTVTEVDLDRFAGRWYVIESIGLDAETGAHDEIEIYRLREDGRIDIELHFREGSFDGPRASIPQLGWVHNEETRAEWRVRPFWPLSLAYLIIDLAPDYQYTVIGHPSKRWVWIMARTPSLDAATLAGIRERLAASGHDIKRLVAIPQRPLDARDDPPE